MVRLVDCEVPTRNHHLYNVGIYTEDTSDDDQCLFVTELHDLLDGLVLLVVCLVLGLWNHLLRYIYSC